jgi:hypothetical protein
VVDIINIYKKETTKRSTKRSGDPTTQAQKQRAQQMKKPETIQIERN